MKTTTSISIAVFVALRKSQLEGMVFPCMCVSVCKNQKQRGEREHDWFWGSQHSLILSLLVNYYLNEDLQGT